MFSRTWKFQVVHLFADKSSVDDLTREFVAESMEGLDRMERSLTELEVHPQNRLLVDEIFRTVHTIKGSAGFLEFARLQTLAHAGETLLSSLRTGKIVVTGELISGLLELLDSLRAVLRLIELTGGEGQRRSDEDFATIARLMELNEAGLVSAALGRIVGAAELHGDAVPDAAEPESGMHETDVVDNVERRVFAQPADRTIRVDVDVLNRLMNQVGELVLTRNQLLRLHTPDDRFIGISRRIDAVTSELRETVMRVRLQPVGNLFGKFPRLVRDLARVCGKQVRLEVQGQATGLDKSLLEAIRDPLTHALRNAIDHGLETPQQRLRAGKNAEGVIHLRAFHQNGCVVVELRDDGAGICPDKVAAKAVERGIISQACAARMSDQERIELVFAPGLTTAAEVTHVSGRGVGMDIVRADVEAAGGRVRLDSVRGQGTTVRLTLPLTLAIVPALVVRSAGQSFAIPESALLQLIYIPAGELIHSPETIGDQQLYRTRRGVVPVLRLASLLELSKGGVSESGCHLALLDHEGCRLALVVDEIVAPEEIVVKPISALLRRSGFFSGAAILGSGELAMILDVAGLRAASGLERSSAAASGEREPEAPAAPLPAEPFLVYEVATFEDEGATRDRSGCTERRILPLSSVDRIEVVQLEHIERVGGRTALCFGPAVIEVSAGGSLLDELHNGLDKSQITAVICRRGASLHAVLATRVIGISEHPILSGGDDNRVALLDDRLAFFQEPPSVEAVLGAA